MRTGLGVLASIGVMILALAVVAAEAAGPRRPTPHANIPDPPDDAERHSLVRVEDDGP